MALPYIKNSNIKRAQAITDIIESVAMEEFALAHILNAEGEGLCKMLDLHGLTLDDIISANRSVMEVIKTIYGLECQLAEKLKVFKNCMCGGRSDGDDDFCDSVDRSDDF